MLWILLLVVIWKVLLLGIVYLAQYIVPLSELYIPERLLRQSLPYILWVWGNFDGAHYVSIARSGYFYGQQPFFPLYPYLIRLVYEVFYFQIPYLVVGQIISIFALLVALRTVLKLLEFDGKSSLRKLMIAAILLFPTSFFLTAIYNDSLFFLFSTLTLYAARRQKWVLGSLYAALATLTRLNGLALLFVLLGEYIVGNRKSLKMQWDIGRFQQNLRHSLSISSIQKSQIYSVTLIPLAFMGYLIWVQRFFHNWQLVFSVMKNWNQDKVTFPLQVVWRYLKILLIYPQMTIPYLIASIEFLSLLVYLFFIIYSFKRIRLSYWIFFFVSILIPTLTGTFQGMPRYGLHLYPFYLSVGLWISQKSLYNRIIYFAISIILLIFMLTLFTRGYFVA